MIITGIPTTPTLSTEAAHKNYAQQTISLPVGTILMFAGTSANVPVGCLLCDGTHRVFIHNFLIIIKHYRFLTEQEMVHQHAICQI